MSNKTCGECKYFVTSNYLDVCVVECETRRADSVCKYCDEFEPKVITNGDVIRQGGNRALAEFLWKLYKGHICSFCVFIVADDDRKKVICKRPPDKTCVDGIEAWLNAPAESEI